MSLQHLPTFSDLRLAQARIKDYSVRTPLLQSPALNARLGGRVLIKAEGLQPTGSFKLRGAVNRIAVLSDGERKRGVVARSSGNHGQAIAYAAAIMQVAATVVVPTSAPRVKIQKIRDFGAKVVEVPMADLSRVATRIAETEGLVLVPPADDFHVVAGAGTCVIEIFEDCEALGLVADVLLTCCSGGGLTAGCLLARDALSPTTTVIAVEAEGFEKMANSLRAGHQMDLAPGGHSICDAINGLFTAQIPFEIIRNRQLDLTSVSDDAALEAMAVGFGEFGLAVEPGGSVGLAALLSGKVKLTGRTAIVIFSGRNLDADVMARALARG